MWNCLPDHLKEQRWPSCSLKIDPDAFSGLKNLTSLQLAGNSLKTIPPLPKQLEVLGLEFNNIFHIVKPLGTPLLKQLLLSKNCFYANPCYQSYFIDQRVFQDLPELLNLTLSYNNVTIVPLHLPLSLESLDLGENKITHINKESFSNLKHLQHLNLGWNCQRCDHASEPCFPCPNNQSLNLHQDAFLDQKDSLISLSLRGNSLRTLPQHVFARLRKLQELDLSDNFLAYAIQNGTFYEELQNVVSLSLLYNYEPQKSFPELILSPSIEKMTALRELYLSGLFFKVLSNHSLAPLVKLPRLESLELRMNFICSVSIDAISQLRTLRRVGLSQNMLAFSSCFSTCTFEAKSSNYQKRDTGQLILQTQRVSLPSPELNTMQVSDEDYCPFYYSMWHFKKQICSKNLFFDLSQNSIPWLNASTFRGMEKVVCIDLSYNYISQTLNGRQFTHLSKLTYLNMAHNRIDLYSEKAFQEIGGTLKALDLSSNEFHFVMKEVHCAYPESLAGVNVLSIDLHSCQEIFGSIAFLCTLLLTLAATSIPLLKHLYGWDLWYCIQILWTGHKGHTPADGSSMTENQYDAFVVFDTSNKAVRDWIYKEMVVRLENRGRWRFRLCLEERDWLPGVSCIENLHKAVYNSRKTVFVLTSPSGCSHESGVIRQAFLLVQQRLLDEKVDVAVLVLLDFLFPKFKYLQMRKRICKKSVLSWPKNPRVQPLFWNNLRVALVSDNIKAYNKNVTESFF
ncbi:hypothetical protein Q8A67_010515 [Cirrhinus molitorella]|uniref:TIR domain-containing protein n=1 Tax=Cirrhinus molitorella TaxID=172907 RepID=A0AA88Q1L9_9TELE|nr:hypothetical protein Q8A67_010515 [Cirrhinus molitorella]